MNDNSASTAGVSPDAEQALAAHVAATQEKLRRSVMIGRLQNDPLADVVDALADAIGIQHDLHRASLSQVGRSASGGNLGRSPAAGAGAPALKLAQAYNRRTLALVGAVLLIIGVVGALGGYLAGRSSAVATVSAVEAAAVRDGPDAAALWAQLMTANDGATVVRTCKETGARSDGGRRACVLGLWTEPAVGAGPRTVEPSRGVAAQTSRQTR